MYLGGGGHHFMPATTILRKFYFSKKACKIQEILKNSKVSFAFNLDKALRGLLTEKIDLLDGTAYLFGFSSFKS